MCSNSCSVLPFCKPGSKADIGSRLEVRLSFSNRDIIRNSTPEVSFVTAGLSFIRHCVQPKTGLVRRWETDPWTTPTANALAAMVLIHEQDLATSAQIFQPFQHYYQAHAEDFSGLPQFWNVETGQPELGSVHWESDAAFMILALLAFQKVSGDSSSFHELLVGLKDWLVRRSTFASVLLADSVVDMVAALALFQDEPLMPARLAQLKALFFSDGRICSHDYQHQLSHAIRAALVFGDVSGLAFAKNFFRTETWGYDGVTRVTAASVFADASMIHVEISAQLLLTAQLLKLDALLTEFPLAKELAKLRLKSGTDPHVRGLPTCVATQPGKPLCHFPALEPTCHMLFAEWGWNLFLGK